MNDLNISIQHDTQQQRFILPLDPEPAILDYQLGKTATGQTFIDFTHTFVPPALRGKGFAEKLVRQGLKWAREQGYELHASCWYARMFLRE